MKAKAPQAKGLENMIDYNEVNEKRRLIQRIKDNNLEKLVEAKKEVAESSPDEQYLQSKSKQRDGINVQIHSKSRGKLQEVLDKNPTVSDTDKMLFDKKFKNFLNHRQEYINKARNNISNKNGRNNHIKKYQNLGDAQYYNEEQVLSNTGSDYQYKDADDMQAAYEQMTTGKKRKGAQKQLFHCEYYENQFRKYQFLRILSQASQEQQTLKSVHKDHLLNYLFDQPSVMMLYSINPYQLGDELAELQTKNNGYLNYQEYSAYLLADRQPTFFDYTPQNLAEARKIGRGIKCAPIIAKWIDESGIYEFLIDLYKDIDMHGDGRVDQIFLAKKIRKQAEKRRLMEVQVIEIVNINKTIPLNRLIYEIQFEARGQDSDWTFEEFEQFLSNYKRRVTPQKDKLITKLIMAGKYDSSYVYILSQEILEIVKEIFEKTPKFAEYFVRKQKFLQNICKDGRYKKIQGMSVRSESNRYVKKQTFEQTLIRMHAEGEQYLDIQQVMDFLTNRGRPKLVQYRVYIENLQRQLKIIEDQEKAKLEKYGEGYQTTSSDQQFNEIIRQKRIKRKQQKLLKIRNQNNFSHDKKFCVTIPVPFGFDSRDKTKKISIRQQKMKEMLDEKEKKLIESMRPFRAKDVPAHVKDNLYEKMLKDEARERKERLQRFRLQIMSQVNVSQHLMRPKSTQIHCDFSSEQYKFIARPMPWYCEVNLLDRINKQKLERRQRILQQIITRNTDFDLPEGVQRMIKRQDQMQQKRAAKRTASTGSSGDCTFIPKICHGVPDFKTIHQHLHFDLENAKNVKEPLQSQPFSFENRPKKSRTTHQAEHPPKKNLKSYSKYEKAQNQQDYSNIPKTQKFEALVELRRRQFQEKEKQVEKQKRSDAIRKLREEKFAPIVRQALKSSHVDVNKSRAIVADKIKEFKREEKRKKMQYENQMIKIYTKVFKRPLLIQSGGMENGSKIQQENSPHKNSKDASKKKPSPKKQEKASYLEDYPERHPEGSQNYHGHKQMNQYEEDRRRAVQDHHPGQYPQDDQQGQSGDYEDGFHESQMYEEEYQAGNMHTS